MHPVRASQDLTQDRALTFAECLAREIYREFMTKTTSAPLIPFDDLPAVAQFAWVEVSKSAIDKISEAMKSELARQASRGNEVQRISG